MIAILKKFFDFCEDKNRRMFYHALAVGVFIAICEAAKFPAIYLILDGFLSGSISGSRILIGFLILLVSVILESFFRGRWGILTKTVLVKSQLSQPISWSSLVMWQLVSLCLRLRAF